MTKEETIRIMAMLGAFYSGGKNDPKIQAEAWYRILHKYNYETAQKAVLHYAENDTREYATFPAVGVIVKEIRMQKMRDDKPVREVIHGISFGRGYEDLSADAKKIISEPKYTEWLGINAEVFASKADYFADLLASGHALLIE